jgi:hypothetical protein
LINLQKHCSFYFEGNIYCRNVNPYILLGSSFEAFSDGMGSHTCGKYFLEIKGMVLRNCQPYSFTGHPNILYYNTTLQLRYTIDTYPQ